MRTSDEIKQDVKMVDVLARYGLKPNRAGFIHCPFHTGDKGASLKVYENDYHCFGCGANGDIFDFVMRIDGVSFKDAFLSLGGEYERPTDKKSNGFKRRLQRYQREKEREQREMEEQRKRDKRNVTFALIDFCRDRLSQAEPFSDDWVFFFNELQKLLVKHSELTGVPYDGEVIRLE